MVISVIKYLKDINKLVNINEEFIRKGFINIKWLGRIEKIKENLIFIIDGVYNEDGVKFLVKVFDKNFKGRKLILLIGMLEDKDIDSVLEILLLYFNKVIIIILNNLRVINLDILREKVLKYVDDVILKYEIEDVVNYILEILSEDDIIISVGLLYMIGIVRILVKKL